MKALKNEAELRERESGGEGAREGGRKGGR